MQKVGFFVLRKNESPRGENKSAMMPEIEVFHISVKDNRWIAHAEETGSDR